MKTLNKSKDKDFIILNLTDTQLSNEEWADGHKARRILEHTVRELIERTSPNLITISGDLAWAGHDHAYDMLASFIDSFNIPWANVWGNHDNQNGAEYIDSVATRYMSYKNCIYEKGDRSLGNGNYVICIEEQGRPVEAVIMIDSHDRDPYIDAEGKEVKAWSRLTEEQKSWILQQSAELKAKGFAEATVILHIPIYDYRTAFAAAFNSALDPMNVTPEQAEGTDCWNEGYTDSIGVQYEGVGSYPAPDGVLETLKQSGIIKTVVAGHEHVNNWMVNYEGIKLVYSLKTGMGCYWNPILNGGTVLAVGSDGIREIKHEFVDISEIN